MITDSVNAYTEGDTVAINVVLQFPPRESSKILVIFIILYNTFESL